MAQVRLVRRLTIDSTGPHFNMQCLRSTWVVSGCVGLHSHHDMVIYWGDSGDGLQKKRRGNRRKFDEVPGKFDEALAQKI